MSIIDRPKKLWRRLFRKNDYYGEIVERVIEAQVRAEKANPAGYTLLQRQTALMQRAAVFHGAAVPPPLFDLIVAAASDWERASKAAVEER